MDMKVLCTGDIHIGRRPASIPAGADPHAWSTGRFFERLVDFAIRESVDVLAVSGDIIDKSNRFFEAAAPLEIGLRRLASAGIDTVAVAGNHDFDALPRFVDHVQPERFTLLGRGGRWESVHIERAGMPRIRFDGWSFPAEHVRDNPLRHYDLPVSHVPVIGLLHADFEERDSAYAPIRSTDLHLDQVSCWLLGHIHKPGMVKETLPFAFYPGSPQALHSGETGAHGPWLLDFDSAGPLRPQHISLAVIRFDRVLFDITSVDTESEFQARASSALRIHAGNVRDSAVMCPNHLAVRLQAAGRTGCLGLLRKFAAALLAQDNQWEYDGCSVALDEIDLDSVRPCYDLHELARGAGPPAVLSRLLLAMEDGALSAEIETLIAATRERMIRGMGQPVFSALPADMPTNVEVAATLMRQGYRTLDILLTQKEGA